MEKLFRLLRKIETALYGNADQERAADRNRKMAEQQLAAFRDPTKQFGSSKPSPLDYAAEPPWIAIQREMLQPANRGCNSSLDPSLRNTRTP